MCDPESVRQVVLLLLSSLSPPSALLARNVAIVSTATSAQFHWIFKRGSRRRRGASEVVFLLNWRLHGNWVSLLFAIKIKFITFDLVSAGRQPTSVPLHFLLVTVVLRQQGILIIQFRHRVYGSLAGVQELEDQPWWRWLFSNACCYARHEVEEEQQQRRAGGG